MGTSLCLPVNYKSPVSESTMHWHIIGYSLPLEAKISQHFPNWNIKVLFSETTIIFQGWNIRALHESDMFFPAKGRIFRLLKEFVPSGLYSKYIQYAKFLILIELLQHVLDEFLKLEIDLLLKCETASQLCELPWSNLEVSKCSKNSLYSREWFLIFWVVMNCSDNSDAFYQKNVHTHTQHFVCNFRGFRDPMKNQSLIP